MKIVFDSDFDSGAWPGPLGERDAAAGEAWVGPAGLLGLLETALGLGGPNVSFSERAAALVKRCRAQEGFWSASANVDPLATARTLLQWRDALWMEGWRGEPVAPRLAALASVTQELAPGMPDRLAEVVAALSRRHPHIEAIELFVPAEALPRRWREVLTGLARHGCRVAHVEPPAVAAKGDLARAREEAFEPAGDGSLQLIRPHGPLEAAEQVAAWLSAHVETAGGQTVIIGPDAVLDRALRRHGLPTVGGPMLAQDDALLQIVPLVLAMGWNPPDPQRALELLTLPVGPVRRAVARKLVRALHEWPAVDSDAWRAALDEGLAAIEEAEERQKLQERLDVLLRPTVADASYPITEARRRLQAVGRWMQGRMALDEENAGRWGRAYGQCSALERLLDETGLDAFTAPQLKRFLEEATGGGLGDAPFAHEAGLAAVATPGAICGPAETVIWWGFDRSRAPQFRSLPFSADELQSLMGIGIELPSPGAEAVQSSRRWSRPLTQATGALLLVCPRRGDDGEELFAHPLFDEIDARLSGAAQRARLVRDEPLGIESRRKRRSLHPIPAPVRTIAVRKGAIARRDEESPSSAGALLGCSVKWVLEYVGKVRGGESARLPEAEQLLGSTAHAILERLLKGPKLEPDEAHRQAGEHFDREGPRMAAVLFQPGAEAERAQARRATAEAARALFRLLQNGMLHVLEVEKARTRKGLGTELTGTPDLLLGGDDGTPRIVDLKWGGARYRRESLQAGTSYQLATYSFLASEGREPFPPTAYFIVGNQALYTTDGEAFPGAHRIDGPAPKEIWEAFEQSHAARWAEVEQGRLEAPANPDDVGEIGPVRDGLVDGQLVLAAPCRFCDYAVLCGKAFASEIAAIEGGEA